jgi:hypothetical protein
VSRSRGTSSEQCRGPSFRLMPRFGCTCELNMRLAREGLRSAFVFYICRSFRRFEEQFAAFDAVGREVPPSPTSGCAGGNSKFSQAPTDRNATRLGLQLCVPIPSSTGRHNPHTSADDVADDVHLGPI